MNPRIDIHIDTLGEDIRIAAYVFAENGDVVSRFDLIQDKPILVAVLGDLRVRDAMRGFLALSNAPIHLIPDAEAVNRLEHAKPGSFDKIANAHATAA